MSTSTELEDLQCPSTAPTGGSRAGQGGRERTRWHGDGQDVTMVLLVAPGRFLCAPVDDTVLHHSLSVVARALRVRFAADDHAAP